MDRKPATSSGAMLFAISSSAFLFSWFIAEKPCRSATITHAAD